MSLEDSTQSGNGGPNRQPWVSVFNLCNAAVGAGVIAFPFAFRQTGAVGGVMFTCLVWLLEVLALCILIRASEHFSASSYQELVLKALGPHMAAVVAATMLVYLTGSLIAYLIIVGDVFHPIFAHCFGDTSLLSDRRVVILLFASVVVLPLSLKRTIESLKWTSLISVAMLGYISVALICIGTAKLIERGGPPKEIKLFTFNLQSFAALDIFVFAFQCHIQVVPIFAELASRPKPMCPHLRVTDEDSAKEPLLADVQLDADESLDELRDARWSPRVRAMDAVIFISLGACLVAYSLVGEFGYLTFPDVESDVLRSFGGSNPFMNFARVGMALVAMACYPLNSHPARSIVNDWLVSLLHLDPRFSLTRHVQLTFLFWVLALGTAVSVTDLGMVFSLVGSTGGVLVIFVIPAFLLFWGCPLFAPKDTPLTFSATNGGSVDRADVVNTTRRRKPGATEAFLGGAMLFFGAIIFLATTYSTLAKYI